MKVERAIFDQIDPDSDALADARAEADIAAGRVVDNALVTEWLAQWGTKSERPAPPEWLA